MTGGSSAEPLVTLAEAQAFARVETGEEEALLAGLIRSASGLCEAFIGHALIERGFTEALTASGDWQKLGASPVRSVNSVSSNGMPLPVSAYAIDVDSRGDGWVRIVDPAVSGIIEVSGTTGIATDRNGIPEPIRHGVLRLVAHLFAARDGDGGSIPAAITALWRPYRRMALA
jgi:uncharacterized phiE125 gp8 family phage protein